MSTDLRRATASDLDVVQHHRDAMFLDMGIDPTVVAAGSPGGRAWLERTVPTGQYLGLLAVEATDVVGGVGVTWLDLPPNMHTALDMRAYILNMYVEPSHRRRGLARQLVEEALSVCRDAGVDLVNLHASDFGRHLYESMGFTTTNEMRLTLS
jgi:ribosomal protein S18 acetylase RimI-like enzyme